MVGKLVTVIAMAASLSFAATKNISAKEIRSRFEVTADMYTVDSTGTKILSGPVRTNYWRANPETGVLEGNWSSKFEEGAIALRHHWQVQDDGTIKLTLEEFTMDPKKREEKLPGSLIDKKEFVVKNLEPVIWQVKNVKSENYIVRYVPGLREISSPLSVDNLPLAGTSISVSDSEGYLWADDVHFQGKYSGLTSHRGTLILSYLPFKGAKELGFAEGNQILLNAGKNYRITLKSGSSFLPAGVTAKVYAIYAPDKKSKGFNSLHTFDSNKESRIQEVLKE